jgi:hypothetical protein
MSRHCASRQSRRGLPHIGSLAGHGFAAGVYPRLEKRPPARKVHKIQGMLDPGSSPAIADGKFNVTGRGEQRSAQAPASSTA